MSARPSPEIAGQAPVTATAGASESAPTRGLEADEIQAVRAQGVAQRAMARAYTMNMPTPTPEWQAWRFIPPGIPIARAAILALLVVLAQTAYMLFDGARFWDAIGTFFFILVVIPATVMLWSFASASYGGGYSVPVRLLAGRLGTLPLSGRGAALAVLEWLDSKWTGCVEVQEAWRRREAGGHPTAAAWFMRFLHEGHEVGLFIVKDCMIQMSGHGEEPVFVTGRPPGGLPVMRIDLYYPQWSDETRHADPGITERLGELGYAAAIEHGGVHLRCMLKPGALDPVLVLKAFDCAHELALGVAPRMARPGDDGQTTEKGRGE